jgi:hypothetical protein
VRPHILILCNRAATCGISYTPTDPFRSGTGNPSGATRYDRSIAPAPEPGILSISSVNADLGEWIPTLHDSHLPSLFARMTSFWDLLTPEQQHALLEGPALTPPPGVLPNFVDPPNRNVMTYGILFTCASLSAVVVAIRVYTKAFCTRRILIEDCELNGR